MKQFKDYFDCVPYLETERFILVPFAREDMEDFWKENLFLHGV